MKYARVLLNLPFEAEYSYIIPEKSEGAAEFGMRVAVPFGKVKEKTGYIIDVTDEEPKGDFELREIKRLIDKKPIFNREQLNLAEWMGRIYFSSRGTNLSAMIPSGRRESSHASFPLNSEFRRNENLTDDQAGALEILRRNDEGIYYIFGVTGSGKTEVYLRRAEDIINKGGQVLYIVPEIILTEQVSKDIMSRFNGKAALFHSSMTPSERLKVWNGVMDGSVRILIGARSAVFAPFENLKLIILDEEHDPSYKSDSSPRYHARQVAQERAKNNSAQFIMGSATPSLEAWNMMHGKNVRRIDMKTRISGGRFPDIRIVNSLRSGRNVTPELEAEIRKTLSEKKGVMILLNRRGFTYGYICSSCGHVFVCPNCSVSLTYHKHDSRAHCHTCGWVGPAPVLCPECGSRDINPSGYGTENVEDELHALFPFSSIARLDTDSVNGDKQKVRKTLEDFEAGRIDILLGTQMIAKGLNFPLVSLVGVLGIDSSLLMPDFRASERAFDLLHQVSGRAGRYRADGLVLIQTTQPNSPAIKAVVENDLEGFYRGEMLSRKRTNFPPYSRIIRFVYRGRNEGAAMNAASSLYKRAVLISEGTGVEVFPATQCIIAKKAGQFRYSVIVRSSSAKDLFYVGHKIADGIKIPRGIYLEIDTDPLNIM